MGKDRYKEKSRKRRILGLDVVIGRLLKLDLKGDGFND